MKKIGPPLPPHLEKKRAAQQLEREKKIKGCALPDSSSHIGPIAPPSLVEYGSRKKDSATENEDDHDHDDDSDEGVLIGPMPTHDDPHGSTKTEWVQLQRSIDERVELMEKKVDEDQNPLAKKIERGEWMTVPPTSRSMHELQSLKSRKFSSKSKGSDFDPTWTQTPQTRHEMASGNLSQLSSKESSIPHESMKKRQRSPPVLPSASTRDRDLSAKVAEYNSQYRDTSLLEMYQSDPTYAKRLRKHEKEATSRPFDREKDLKARPALSAGKLMSLRHEASKMSEKFSHGKTQYL